MTLAHPYRTAAMAPVALCWLALSMAPAEASCRSVDPSCRERPTTSEDVMARQSPQDWDGPLRSIYHGYLAPVFASCGCHLFGIEEVESWNEPDDPDLHWWLVNVVLGFSSGEGWQMRAREYLFSARGTASPALTSLGKEQPWPSDLELVH